MKRNLTAALAPCFFFGLVGAVEESARADIDLKLSGSISSDIRYRLAGEEVPATYPSQYQLLENGFSRNENRVRTAMTLKAGEHVKAVADLELVYYGYSDVNDIDAATLRERVDPYFFEAHAAYVDIYKIAPHLDLRIGRQVVKWGASDLFNPTSNVNTLDYSDPLLFGKALANNMIKADWNPLGDWNLTAVWVPVFRPGQLPRSAPLAVTQIDRPAPVQEEAYRNTLSDLAVAMPPTHIDVIGMQPDVSIKNSQVAGRLAGRLAGQDVSLSYYNGRWGLPVPAWTINQPDGSASVGVIWPRMQVFGADMAGSIAPLGGVGYWLEGAVIVPQEVTYGLINANPKVGNPGPITFAPIDQADPSKPVRLVFNGSGTKPTVVPGSVFWKATAGADYSAGEHVYLNAQYVHGFIDEFGNGVVGHLQNATDAVTRVESRIGDYLIGGADFKVDSGLVTMRLFLVAKLPTFFKDAADTADYRFTGVLFPQIIWQAWDATELTLGAFVFLGDRSTKFGDPSAGASEIFGKVKFSF